MALDTYNISEKEMRDKLKEWYIKITGENLNIDNPRSLNEKIQWLKIYDNLPIKSILADKYRVREWIKNKIGEEYLIPLLGVWERFDDIDFNALPDKFVLKCNHGSSWVRIIDKNKKFDVKFIREEFNNWMNTNYAFVYGFEMQYDGIKPLILAEKYYENEPNDLYEYKIYCFNGQAKFILLDVGRFTGGVKRAVYDTDWNFWPDIVGPEKLEKLYPRPSKLKQMIELAEILSQDFVFIRVDFYQLNNGEIKFSEVTFTPASGIIKCISKETNIKYGDMLALPRSLSLCTYCKGRLAQAKVTIPIYLNALDPYDELIFVDYDDPENSGLWVKSLNDPRISVYKVDNMKWWHATHARNIADLKAKNDLILNIDIDVSIDKTFIRECKRLKKNTFKHVKQSPETSWQDGTACFWKEDFLKVRGYDEGIVGRGNIWNFYKALMHNGIKEELFSTPIKMIGDWATDTRIIENAESDLENQFKINREITELLFRRDYFKLNVSRNWGLGGYKL